MISQTELNFYSVLIGFLILTGIIMLLFNSVNKRRSGKSNLALSLIGWILIGLSVIAQIVIFVLFLKDNTGVTGMFIFVVLSPLFIIAGFIGLTAGGLSSLINGCRGDENGNVNKDAVIRGAVLMAIAIALIATLIISVAVLMDMQSSAHGSEPVRMM